MPFLHCRNHVRGGKHFKGMMKGAPFAVPRYLAYAGIRREAVEAMRAI